MARNSLQAVLEQQARKAAPPSPAPQDIGAALKSQVEDEPGRARPGKFHRPSRDGRKLIAGHFEPKVAKQLKLLAVEEETTVQALLEEALDLLFVKKGRDRVSVFRNIQL